tara:strand:- start:3804 stop:10037 length:6234 start_codon:yes stop_codon:yes gene_type:complete
MPLNKLENFIKNTDGRTIYVNPNDINATDAISNQGTSLTEPFRTVQRALIESARFSYVRGNDNDLIEKTTIVLYPGNHTIDNRPGYGIKTNNIGAAVAVSPTGEEVAPATVFNLKSDTNFDIESTNNILWHFNSIYGGVVVPRGTSIVGMDLRKTKIRPKYVPNPTDPSVDGSAIFRITGSCYFWQFTIFDGPENGLVYTDPKDFSLNNQSRPSFSHHKLTGFEYADGVNPIERFGELTDLQMYYDKLSNAYNEASGRNIDEKFPQDPEGFAPMLPEYQIVGAFATDPIRIASLISGDGFTPDSVITVETVIPHGLSTGTPIKIRGVAVSDYNISTKVAVIISPTSFTYPLAFVRPELPARPSVSSATVTVETDTVTGASPYIFNVSMRSVWGINGMLADGAKATGFRSMVVAQFTAISLQKDDRAFVKYNDQSRRYNGINVSTTVRGAELSAESSSTNSATVYHLDPRAVYRPEWETTHIKMSNDAVIQIVSVFAIGFNQHFAAVNGADASITNSNSNFGQFALLSIGFKNDAFAKDDTGFVTQVITPKTAYNPSEDEISRIGWVNIDFDITRTQAIPAQLYLLGYTNKEDRPPFINQGFRLGANNEEVLYQETAASGDKQASIFMVDNLISGANRAAFGTNIAVKSYPVLAGPGQGPTSGSTLTLPPHGLLNGETIRVFSANADLPENMEEGQLYYANVVDTENIRISTSESNALNDIFLEIFGGTELRVESRVNDKSAGEPGHPMQFDDIVGNWFVHTNSNSELYQYIILNPTSQEGFDFVSYYLRASDNRSLDDKLYRLRYVIPKETSNAKPPTPGYVIQSSSTTGARNNDDFDLTTLTFRDYEYDRNPRYIVDCNYIPITAEIEVRSQIPHQLSVGDKINTLNITSTKNPDAVDGRGYDGEFLVTRVDNARVFRYSSTDIKGFTRDLIGDLFTNDTNDRNILLPRFQRKDNQTDVFVYRIEEIVAFTEGVRDGIYHLFCVNGSNAVTETFTKRNYNQPIEDLYPQLDTDNINNNPASSVTFAARAPLGKVSIDNKQTSITRETIDKLTKSQNENVIELVTEGASETVIEFQREHQYNGVYNYTTLNGGSGYTDGTYYNVKLLTDGIFWDGASAEVTVIAGSVTELVIMDPGSGYKAGDTLFLDPSGLGPGGGATVSISASDIESSIGFIAQFTGGGVLNPDSFAPIIDVPSASSITVHNESIAGVTTSMYVLTTDSGTDITSTQFDAASGITTFTTNSTTGFGLQRGNSFVVFDVDGKNLGKYYVSAVPVPSTVTAVTNADVSSAVTLGKCGYDDNDANTGPGGENIGVRGVAAFDLGIFYLVDGSGTDNQLTLSANDGGVTGSVAQKLPLGRYLQLGSEIVRIASTSFDGLNLNIVTVIRGALGTSVINHPVGTKVRAIKPLAIELRRPSILRASGHTFEYLGYGPGNYSTALPQLQVRQLPDDEVYLVQAQELSCGQVVYTGMSDNGDFYIGNTKYSATSGTQITFDVPIPTIAGQNASNNNVVFDEVIINRRLFVAGGDANEVLSQFDGPVKFTETVNLESSLGVTGNSSLNTLSILSTLNSVSLDNGGALTVRGGAAIAKDLYVGGDVELTDLTVNGNLDVLGDAEFGQDVDIVGAVDIGETLTVGGNFTGNGATNQFNGTLGVTGDADFDSDVNIDGSVDIGNDLDVDGNLVVNGSTNAINGNLTVTGNITMTRTDRDLYTNGIIAVSGSSQMDLWRNQVNNSADISIGGSGNQAKVIFNTTKLGTGEGGSDGIASSDGGVDIKGSLVVRDKVIAKEFVGDGLGKPGSIIMWGGNATENNEQTPGSIPKGYLLCNGRSLSKNAYPKLYRAIRGTHGETSTTFRIPDLRERFIVGAGGNNPNVTQVNGYNIAGTGGGNFVQLTTAQIPAHNHSINQRSVAHTHDVSGTTSQYNWRHSHSGTANTQGAHGHTLQSQGDHTHPQDFQPAGGHSHGYTRTSGSSGGRENGDNNVVAELNNFNSGTNNNGTHAHPLTLFPNGRHRHSVEGGSGNHQHPVSTDSRGEQHSHQWSGTSTSNPITHNHTANDTGGGQTHENRPPYMALCYIIQYK